jgi:hypothetical protein
MKNNISMLSFLIGSYNEMVKNFGENDKTNKFFINQLSGLIAIHQVNISDANIICSVIGLKKDNTNFNWENSKKNIQMFIDTMGILEKYKDIQTKEMTLFMFYKENKINENIFKTIAKVYDLDIDQYLHPIPTNNVSSNFGKLDNNSDVLLSKITSEVKTTNEFAKWREFLRKYKKEGFSYYIKNPNAVCSYDKTWYTIPFNEIINTINDKNVIDNSLVNYLNLMIDKPDDFHIEERAFNGCSGYTHTTNSKVTKEAQIFDYKKILKEYKNYILELRNYNTNLSNDDNFDNDYTNA